MKRDKNSLKLYPGLMKKLRKKFRPNPRLDGKFENDKYFQECLARANELLSKITNLDELYK